MAILYDAMLCRIMVGIILVGVLDARLLVIRMGNRIKFAVLNLTNNSDEP